MFACYYRASLGSIGSFIITIKKDKEKYFDEKSCIGVGEGRSAMGVPIPIGRHLRRFELSLLIIGTLLPCLIQGHRKTPGIYCFFSFFNFRFSFGLSWAFFCCSFLPLSFFPLSPISVSPCLSLLFYYLRTGFTSDYPSRCCEQTQVFLPILQVRPAN